MVFTFTNHKRQKERKRGDRITKKIVIKPKNFKINKRKKEKLQRFIPELKKLFLQEGLKIKSIEIDTINTTSSDLWLDINVKPTSKFTMVKTYKSRFFNLPDIVKLKSEYLTQKLKKKLGRKVKAIIVDPYSLIEGSDTITVSICI